MKNKYKKKKEKNKEKNKEEEEEGGGILYHFKQWKQRNSQNSKTRKSNLIQNFGKTNPVTFVRSFARLFADGVDPTKKVLKEFSASNCHQLSTIQQFDNTHADRQTDRLRLRLRQTDRPASYKLCLLPSVSPLSLTEYFQVLYSGTYLQKRNRNSTLTMRRVVFLCYTVAGNIKIVGEGIKSKLIRWLAVYVGNLSELYFGDFCLLSRLLCIPQLSSARYLWG